jgi:hypothetical protein
MQGLAIFGNDYVEETRGGITLIEKAFGSVAHDLFQNALQHLIEPLRVCR